MHSNTILQNVCFVPALCQLSYDTKNYLISIIVVPGVGTPLGTLNPHLVGGNRKRS